MAAETSICREVTGRRARGLDWGWVAVVAAALFPVVAPAAWPAWGVMWGTAFAIFVACKRLTWSRADVVGVPGWKTVAYFVAWPGLDAPGFLAGRDAERPTRGEYGFAAAKVAFGGVLLVALELADLPELVRTCMGMAGVVFVLHFGVFHLLSCYWRARGVEAKPLMDWPVAAGSVGEFWGRRWNTAFRDLAHRFLFRPLTARYGPRAGLLAGFLFSGLMHDAVISLPARGGYGGPTAYFLLQAAGLLAERSRRGRRAGLGRGARGRLFALAVVVLPVPLLFHPPFIARVVLPFLDFVGGVR
jgi:hypothetical protein